MTSSDKPTALPVDIPFISLLGFQLIRFENDVCEMAFNPKDEHLNSFEVAHGGALMTLLDAAMAHAARSLEQAMGVVTVEMKTTFMQPALGALTARANVLHRTPTMAFAEASVFDAAGRICAHGTGTFKYVKRLAAGGRRIKDLQFQSAT